MYTLPKVNQVNGISSEKMLCWKKVIINKGAGQTFLLITAFTTDNKVKCGCYCQ